jgi:hypothetical protein
MNPSFSLKQCNQKRKAWLHILPTDAQISAYEYKKCRVGRSSDCGHECVNVRKCYFPRELAATGRLLKEGAPGRPAWQALVKPGSRRKGARFFIL